MSGKSPKRCGCILLNECGEVLMVKEVASGYIGFPKGARKPLETCRQAALRELYEETGIQLLERQIIETVRTMSVTYFLVIVAKNAYHPVPDLVEVTEAKWVRNLEPHDQMSRSTASAFEILRQRQWLPYHRGTLPLLSSATSSAVTS